MMIYKEAFDRLKTETQMALTDFEERQNTANNITNSLYKGAKKLDNARLFYKDIVAIINDTEGWELEYEEDWHKRVYGEKKE